MSGIIRFLIYLILIAVVYHFGTRFLEDYETVNASKAPSNSGLLDELGSPSPAGPPGSEDSTDSPSTSDNATANTSTPEDPDGNADDPDLPDRTETAEMRSKPPRLGYHGGGFLLSLISLGLLVAWDVSRLIGSGFISFLFRGEEQGVFDDEYEAAETEWNKGNYLDCINMLREYLKNNPRQQHAALRIAEIYEKDLNNPLAAALEYEEILEKKLPRERWGWAAIHLANLYSGPMEKPEQAVELLRRLEREYGDTQAAQKARERLAIIDNVDESAE